MMDLATAMAAAMFGIFLGSTVFFFSRMVR